MLKELIKLAGYLDNRGHHREADYIDAIIVRMAQARAGLGEETHIFSVLKDWPTLKQALMEDLGIDPDQAGSDRDIDVSDIQETWNRVFVDKDGLPTYQLTLEALTKHLNDNYSNDYPTEGGYTWTLRDIDNAFTEYSSWSVSPELGEN